VLKVDSFLASCSKMSWWPLSYRGGAGKKEKKKKERKNGEEMQQVSDI
jgi:hypothetical protein